MNESALNQQSALKNNDVMMVMDGSGACRVILIPGRYLRRNYIRSTQSYPARRQAGKANSQQQQATGNSQQSTTSLTVTCRLLLDFLCSCCCWTTTVMVALPIDSLCSVTSDIDRQYESISVSAEADDLERKPLVPDSIDDGRDASNDRELLRDEMEGMTKLALPLIATYFLETLPGLITIILAGRAEYADEPEEAGARLQKLHLDAASFAVMFSNIVAMAPSEGE